MNPPTDAGFLTDPRRANAAVLAAVGRPVDLGSLGAVSRQTVAGPGRHLRPWRVDAGSGATVLASERDLLFVVLAGRVEMVDLTAGHEPRAELVGEGQWRAFPPGSTVAVRTAASGQPARLLEVHLADRPAAARPDLVGRVDAVAPLPDYYYGYAERYAAVYAAGGETWETPEPNDALLHAIEVLAVKPCQVIDLGCGEGRDSVYLAGEGFEVTAVDVSRAALDKGRERARAAGVGVDFLERDVVYLNDLPRTGFDLALNMGCLHMMPDADLRAAHLGRVFEILRPGGLFVLAHCRERWLEGFYSVPDYAAVGPVIPGRVVPRRVRMRDGGTAMLPLPLVPYKESPPDELRAELTAAGFVVERDLSGSTEAFGNTVVLAARRPD